MFNQVTALATLTSTTMLVLVDIMPLHAGLKFGNVIQIPRILQLNSISAVFYLMSLWYAIYNASLGRYN